MIEKLIEIKNYKEKDLKKNIILNKKYSNIRLITILFLLIILFLYLDNNNTIYEILIIISIIIFIITCILHSKIKNTLIKDNKYIEQIKKYQKKNY